MDISLMRMFSAGPDVSLNGSPTVSPTTACVVLNRTFAAEVACLNVLLGIVPCATCIRHHDCEQEAGGNRADEQAAKRLWAEHRANRYWHNDRQQARKHHFLHSAVRAYGNGPRVIGLGSAFKQSLNFTELSAHFLDHRACCPCQPPA